MMRIIRDYRYKPTTNDKEWVHRVAEVWEMDDVYYEDREGLSQAWERIFKRRLDPKLRLDSWDGGDVIYHLYDFGLVSWFGPVSTGLGVLVRVENDQEEGA